jgi:hypothetical protein
MAQKLNNIFMKKSFEIGVTVGVISIIYRTILFIFGTSYSSTLLYGNLIYLFVIIGIVSNLKQNLNTNKKTSFGNNFKLSLLIVFIVSIIYRGFCFIYYEYIDTFVGQEIFSKTGLSNEKLFIKGFYSFFIINMIIAFVISGAIKNKE